MESIITECHDSYNFRYIIGVIASSIISYNNDRTVVTSWQIIIPNSLIPTDSFYQMPRSVMGFMKKCCYVRMKHINRFFVRL